MNILTIGKLLVPAEQIAFVESFDPASNPEFKPEKPFKGRVVLLNRDTVLTELAPQEFAEANGFHLFAEDNVAVNPLVAFRVETFTATETFKPSKAYLTRLKWFDPGRNERSRLLVTAPETVIAGLSQRGANRSAGSKRAPRRSARTKRAPRNAKEARAK
jgi:hypothetical protein